MSVERAAALALAAVLLCATLAGCQLGDPRQRVLEQRARWNVQLLSWAATGGAIQLDTRVSGPPSSSLEALTVRVDLIDDAGGVVQVFWHTYDLTAVPRGGPKDVLVRVADAPEEIEGVSISLVPDPTPEEERRIRELAEVGAPAG